MPLLLLRTSRPRGCFFGNQSTTSDAVFIDGDHSYKAVVHESKLAREVVRPGGIIVWHDFQNPAVEVTQALTELDWPIMSLRGSWLAFMRIEER